MKLNRYSTNKTSNIYILLKLINTKNTTIMDNISMMKDLTVDSSKMTEDFYIKPEIRIGVLGNVDSGKSSTIGVITKNILDDGKGYARSLVMRHPHEKESGRTSDISQLYI